MKVLVTGVLATITAGIDAQNTGPEDGLSPLQNRVVDVFVEREVSRRADLLVKGFDLLVSIQKTFDQVNKPDTNFTGQDGTPLQLMSAKRSQEIAAAKKKLDRVNDMLGQALNSAQFDGLDKLVKSGGKSEGDDA